MNRWYNKFDKKVKTGKLNCPNCDFFLEERLLYFVEPNTCPNCSTQLGYIDISPYHPVIYTINLDSCPEVIRTMFEYLATKNQKEGFEELKSLFFMINSETENPH